MKEKSKLILENETIIYDEGQFGRWKISVADLEIVGEYTDSNGPLIDDYFFVFVISPNHEYYRASFYSIGRERFLGELGKLLNHKLECQLCNSTNFNSKVMWPEPLVGKKLFDFVPTRSDSLWKKLKHFLFPEYYIKYSVNIRNYLRIEDNDS